MIKIISDGFFNLSAGSCPRGGTGALGVPRGVKQFFFKHGHVAYQINGVDEQNRMQVEVSSECQTGDLGVRSKGQKSLNLGYNVNFKDFYTKLCVCSHK